jgi:hypothetical protein
MDTDEHGFEEGKESGKIVEGKIMASNLGHGEAFFNSARREHAKVENQNGDAVAEDRHPTSVLTVQWMNTRWVESSSLPCLPFALRCRIRTT